MDPDVISDRISVPKNSITPILIYLVVIAFIKAITKSTFLKSHFAEQACPECEESISDNT